MKSNEEIELIQEDTNEIFGKIPSFLVRWGMLFLLVILVVVVGSTQFINYPEVMNGEVVITHDDSVSLPPTTMMTIPATGAGKVQAGQTVYIELDNYPSAQFGRLEGKVRTISRRAKMIGSNMHYELMIDLTNGLVSDAKKSLSFFHEMHGKAAIVVDRLNLFQRLFRFL